MATLKNHPSLPAPRRPVQRRAKSKVDGILRAAVDILANEGYAEASTSKIADRAGVSVGTVYAYFRDKDGVFQACVDRQVDDIVQTFAQDFAASQFAGIEEAVRAVIEASVRSTADNKKTLRALVGNIPGVYDGPMLRDVMHQLYAVAEQVYRTHGITHSHAHARRITYILVNAVTGFFIRMVTDIDNPLSKNEMTEELFRLVMSYLNASKQAARKRTKK